MLFVFWIVFFIKIAHHLYFFFFFFNDTATTEIYTLSLHDALPICAIVVDLSRAVGGGDAEISVLAGDRLYPLVRSEEHTSELQSRSDLVCRLLLEKKKRHRGSLLATAPETIVSFDPLTLTSPTSLS